MFRVISYLLAVAVFTTPWFIGGNWPFTRTILVGAVAAGLFAISGTKLRRISSGCPSNSAFPTIWVLLIVGWLFTAFQASDISSWLQQQVGAENPAISLHQTVDDVSAPLPQTSNVSTKRPISVYPAATREKLVDLNLAVGVFLIATVVLNRPDRLMPVIVTLAASGVAVSFVGILQRLSYNRKVLWQYELLGGGDPFGPFVNGNNAAGFLLIGFSAAMFFVAHKLNSWKSEHATEELSLDGAVWEDSDKRSIFSGLIEAVARMESRHLYFLAALIIIVAGVCTSLSRGGMVALACSAMLGCFLITKTNRLVGILLTLAILAGGVGLVSYTDLSGGIVKELDSLNDLSTAAGPRVQHWIDAVPFIKNNWIIGCGNGTYRVVSPSFDSFFSTKTFAHAESVYVETLVELGIGGLLLLLAVLGYCLAASVKLMRRKDSFDRALGVTGIVCLVGQALSAALDFGIYQPANAIAMATLMGGLVGRSLMPASITSSSKRRSAVQTHDLPRNTSTFQRFATLAFILCASLVSVWATYESYGVESRRAGTRAVKLFSELQIRQQRAPSLKTLELAESQLKTAVEIRPDDANANFYLGELLLMRYRHLYAQQLAADLEAQIAELEKLKAFGKDESTAEIQERRELIKSQQEILSNIKHSQIWNSTAPLTLHQSFRRAERIDRNHAQQSWVNPDVQTLLQPAWDYYMLAENLSPRLPKTQLRLAELDIFIPTSDDSSSPRLTEDDRIKLALSRANANTQLLFDCGFLALNSGNQSEAVRLWSKCLAYPHRTATEKAIIELCQLELPMRRFFEEVLPQDSRSLIHYMRKYFEPTQRSIPMQLLANHTAAVIKRQTEPKTFEQYWLLAEVALLNQDYETAVKNYAEVEKIDANDVPESFRFNYALSLFHTKQYDEAMRNVKICELEHYEPRKVKSLNKQIQRERASKLRAN